MANITIKIKLRDAVESQEFILGTNQSTKINNIGIKTDQYGTFDEIPSNLQGLKVLSFAKANLRFNQQGILCNEDYQDGYLQSESEPLELVFGATDSNGNYSIELTISGDGVAGLTSFVVYGDNLANQFPTVASIDGVPFYSDDYKLVMPLTPNATNSHTIIFTKWNRPNYNACLTLIRATQEYLTYTNTEIDSLQSIERSSVNNSEINYGSIANSGQFELIDEDGELKDLVNDGILPNSNVDVDIYFNNQIDALQHHISNDTNYDTTQGKFTMSLSNKIDMLDTLIYEGFAYHETSKTLYQILNMVMDSLLNTNQTTEEFNSMLSNRCMTPVGEKYIYEYLQMIEIEYPVIEYGYTYREVLDDICKIAQLNLFVNKSNNYEFISARPLLLSGEAENALRATKGTLKEEPNYELIVRNKYDGVEISENIVNNIIDYYTTIFNDNIETKFTTSDLESVSDVNPITSKSLSAHTNIAYGIQYAVLAGGTYAYILAYSSSIIKGYYYTFSININKKSNNNLNKILKIFESLFDNDGNNKFNIYYKEKTHNATGIIYKNNQVEFTYEPFSDSEFDNIDITNGYNVSLTTNATYSQTGQTVSSTATVTLNDIEYSTINIIENNTYYEVTITILCGYDKISLNAEGQSNTTDSASATGTITRYFPQFVNFTLYGNQQTISFDNTSVSSSNINIAQTKANFGSTSTKLLQDKCTFNGEKMSTIIKNNILDDYQYGISNLRLEMFTTDLSTKDGTIVKHLDNGDVLDNGDIVFLTGDKDKMNQQRYWSVYNNEYNYDGTLDESVILNQKREYYGLYNDKYFLGWKHLIDNEELYVTKDISNNNHLFTYNNNTTLNGKLIISKEANIKKIGIYQNNEFNGFINCTKLKEIVLPSIVESFFDYSFAGCTSLKTINIPENVTSLSVNLFNGCTSLDNFYIPNNITYIAGGAFAGCTSLKTIFIPISVTLLGSPSVAYATKTFWGCSDLIIYCEADSKPVNWETNWNVYNENNDTLTVKWGYTREQYEEEISSNT